MGKVYFLLLFFAVFGIFSGERGVNNRLRVSEGQTKGIIKMQGIHCTDWDISESIPGRVPEKRFYQESKGCISVNLWQQPRSFLLFYADIITGKDTDFGKAGY